MSLVLNRSAATEQTISLFEAAAEDNLSSTARLGNILALGPHLADDVLISADLHGNWNNYNQILRLAALDKHPRRHLVLQEVCHGGERYENGGCRSHQMLEEVARLKTLFPGRVHFLLSNHELSELTDYPLGKHGIVLNVSFFLGLKEAYDEGAHEVHQACKRFIGTCPLGLFLPSGILVTHSAPERVDEYGFDTSIWHRPLTDQDLTLDGAVGLLVWGRDYRPRNAECFANLTRSEVLIHGHTPCPRGYAVPNKRQIILDCCGDQAAVALLPIRHNLTRDDVIDSIRML